ncbi:hypothetical protein QRO10_20510 [Paracidovorax citrulli]|uniref:hypothetical protein n=1 Tax=Paracidovorax citrulli TaxID=80869 RepID=UPI000323D4EE|nr:hypothetical protein [Paracidovorax citrulli]WIY29366.1 hypothetical protein QRO09_20315 [Paracidovorax citrulli]WIY38585.1 hypothetical protein QRO10_20510 [Paracidovorax citrulli]
MAAPAAPRGPGGNCCSTCSARGPWSANCWPTCKDALQAQVLRQAFGLQASACPSHYVPASEPFLAAVRCGLGYGMVPELQIPGAVERGELVDVLP